MKKILFITLMLVSILYPQSKKLTLSESIELRTSEQQRFEDFSIEVK